MLRYFAAVIVTLVISFIPLSASGQDAGASEAAKNLLEVMGMESAIEKNIESSVDVQIAQFAQMGLEGEGLEKLKAEMLSFMKETMAYGELEPDLVAMYAEAFTADELNELAEFYETPVGMKTMKLMPQLMARGMELSQTRVQARSGELQQKLVPIFEKYLPREEAPAE